jgi:glucosamine--fructose-6-phosphate aminotransferase (isomerizing)
MVSNILEIKARKGQVIAISEKEIGYLLDSVDDLFELPNCDDRLAIFLATLFSQLFAYYFARIKDCEIDQPRNLAKSVTVE